jgi:hypothetical protein
MDGRTISVRMDGDRTIEIFDLDSSGLLAMESGKADGALVLRNVPGVVEMLRAGRLADLLALLQRSRATPAPLISEPVMALVSRDGARLDVEEGGRVVVTAPAIGLGDNQGSSVVASESESERCWLDRACSASDSWFYQDRTWSWRHAHGTSRWVLVMCTRGCAAPVALDVVTQGGEPRGSWSVAPGHYRDLWWGGGGLEHALAEGEAALGISPSESSTSLSPGTPPSSRPPRVARAWPPPA